MTYILSLLLALLPISVFTQTSLNGKVIRVADGDTLTLLDAGNNQFRIRLYGIDCPESHQDFGRVAQKFTSDLCFGKQVSVEVKDKDRYGRIVGIVFTADKRNVNYLLLEAGLAWHYTAFDRSEAYARAETIARKEKRGLWVQSNAMAPWEFRKTKRKK